MFDLDRFVRAQDPVWDDVLDELRTGRKRSHWMWFVFPQIAGLGRSPTARRYAIAFRAEAEAYLDHPVLGPRLMEATGAAIPHGGDGPRAVFGTPDDLKFVSSMTLFDAVRPGDAFARALTAFGASRDTATLERL